MNGNTRKNGETASASRSIKFNPCRLPLAEFSPRGAVPYWTEVEKCSEQNADLHLK